MSEEIYEELFKNVVINGHYSHEKLNEMKSYIKTLNNKIENLEQQVKKQKEIIDKAKNWIIKYQTEWCQEDEVIRDLKQLLDILKEVSE